MSKVNGEANQGDALGEVALSLDDLLTILDLAALFLDKALFVKHFTPSFRKLFNLPLSDEGQPFDQVLHKICNIELLSDATEVLQTLRPVEREVRCLDEHWYLVRLFPYCAEVGKVDGLIITFVDISQIKQTEQALRESEEEVRFMVEHVQEYAIFRLDKAGLIASWNQGAERICGYTEAEAIGLPSLIIFTPEDQAAGAPASEIEMAKLHGQSLDERWHLRKDGSRFWGSGVMTALWDETGELRGFVKMMRDNTERKQAEEALQASQAQLQALNESLAGYVEKRTKQLRKLATELVLAEQKERERLAHILHDDLQQGLYALQIQLKILNDTLVSTQPEIVVESLQAIKAIIERTIRLTRHLTVELSPPVLHNEGLVEMFQWLAVQMKQRYGLEVEISAEAIPRRYSSEILILLSQLVNELLFNVVKHAGITQAQIEIRVADNRLVIAVIDHGQGFDTEKFFQHPHPTSYGLHSVQDRLALLDGQVSIISQLGMGTRATLYVPL